MGTPTDFPKVIRKIFGIPTCLKYFIVNSELLKNYHKLTILTKYLLTVNS